jgi:thiol-disulfide isomerase/thioredoxin
METTMERTPCGRAPGAWVTVLVLTAAACGGGGGGAGSVGDTLPAVSVSPVGGGAEVVLSDIGGPAVVNLWATWCAPCRKEIPDFQAVHEARGDEVRFVGINIGQNADEIGDYLAEVGATYEQYIDEEGFVQTELEAAAMPTTVVIDADGEIVTRHLGPMDQDALDEAIDAALAG